MIVSAFVKLHGKGVSTSERQEIDGMRLDKKILFISGTIIILLSVVITTSCLTSIVTSLMMDNGKALKTHDLETIGFDFEGKVPEFPMGDSGAGRHLFIHRYPIPAEGRVFGLEYLNDYEDGYAEKQERIVFLMLRPELEEWSILFRYDTIDDNPVKTEGITRIMFDTPLNVQKGDIYATYQPPDSPSGAIPLNADKTCLEQKSSGLLGFEEEHLQVDSKIADKGFNGCRDYFIHLLYQPE